MGKMTFEEFKEEVVLNIKEWLPERFQTAVVGTDVVTKNNGLFLTGLMIKKPDCNIAPTIYLERYYEEYLEGADMDFIMSDIAETRIVHDVTDDFNIGMIHKFETCKEKILPRLVGTNLNEILLEQRPHILIEDLAVIFVVDMGEVEGSIATVPVTNSIKEVWNVDIEEIYQQALINLKTANMGRMKPMSEIITGMLSGSMEEMSLDLELPEDIMQELIPEEERLFVLSNVREFNGASIILDEAFMESVIERVGTQFYLLPSSVHEWLLIPDKYSLGQDELENMVTEVNASMVATDERLSNHVYRYSKERGVYAA